MLARLPLLAALLFAAPVFAKEDVPLAPGGPPFGPDAPQRVAPTHPLFGAMAVAGIEALPEKLASAKRAAFVRR